MDTYTNTNINTYEYDKYDIIDFLEPEYIDDWLNSIPDDIWLKYSKSIETQLSKNYELVLLLYNFYTFKKNIIFDADTCSRIAEKIIYFSDKKYHKYDKILYEWFNLGGVVKGYSIYTDYIESIKIRKIN